MAQEQNPEEIPSSAIDRNPFRKQVRFRREGISSASRFSAWVEDSERHRGTSWTLSTTDTPRHYGFERA